MYIFLVMKFFKLIPFLVLIAFLVPSQAQANQVSQCKLLTAKLQKVKQTGVFLSAKLEITNKQIVKASLSVQEKKFIYTKIKEALDKAPDRLKPILEKRLAAAQKSLERADKLLAVLSSKREKMMAAISANKAVEMNIVDALNSAGCVSV